MAYIPVTLQHQDPDTLAWSDVQLLHAIQVNKTGGGESFDAGADQYHAWLTFVFRWTPLIEQIHFDPQSYRLMYRGHSFDIRDYDDYMERHQTVRIMGVCYG